jgi:hypothetical protein
MTLRSRRSFFIQIAAAGTALAAATQSRADAALVSEKDPQATALGYVADSTKADGAKYPKHTKEQHCGTCALYQGKAGAAAGPCPLFAGKQVSAAGWCSAWAKKA